MKLSTSNGIMYKIPGRKEPLLPDVSFAAIKRAGFERIDLNLWAYCAPDGAFAGDAWQQKVEELIAASEKYDLPVHQTHGNVMGGTDWDDPAYPYRELHTLTNLRCIAATKAVGGKWMVLHPFNLAHAPLYDSKSSREACIAYLAPFIEEAKRQGVGIAVENMVDFGRRRRRYCGGDIFELIDLIDTINDPDVRICLDTGHANVSGLDVAAAVRAIGSERLVATHINDNHKRKDADSHLLPHFGDVDWTATVRALKEIGYEGDFAYEIGSQRVPLGAREEWLAFVAGVARRLMAIE